MDECATCGHEEDQHQRYVDPDGRATGLWYPCEADGCDCDDFVSPDDE